VRKKGTEKPVIVLFLAILTIVVAITVSFWMGGLASQLARSEQVEISNAYANKLDDGGWNITVQLRNTGSMDSTLNLLLINGKQLSDYGSGTVATAPSLPLVVEAGYSKTVIISVKNGTTGFITGATIDLVLCSSAGRQYPQEVMLT
jgi:hypothetical protein